MTHSKEAQAKSAKKLGVLSGCGQLIMSCQLIMKLEFIKSGWKICPLNNFIDRLAWNL